MQESEASPADGERAWPPVSCRWLALDRDGPFRTFGPPLNCERSVHQLSGHALLTELQVPRWENLSPE